MTKHRNAVRTYLRGNGSAPLMWEEITPQDKSARLAYLDGVDQATIFVLLRIASKWQRKWTIQSKSKSGAC